MRAEPPSRRRGFSIALSAAVVAGLLGSDCTTQQARAEEPSPKQLDNGSPVSDSKDVPPREWYGAPIVLADLAALGLFLVGVVASDHGHDFGSALMGVGVGTYLLGGPVVHFTEHQQRKGFASLGLRAGALAVGFGLGVIIGGVVGLEDKNGCPKETWCGMGDLLVGAAVGLGSGYLIGAVVDSAALAYKPATAKPLALSVTPVYQPATHQTGLALRGAW